VKKTFVFASCVVGFMFIAAPTAVEYHQVLLNGKPFVKAAMINGVAAVKLEEFARAGGANITLEPGFTLVGSTLNATISGYSTPAGKQKEGAKEKWLKYPDYKEQVENKDGQAGKKAVIKGEIRPLFKVNKPGAISTHIINADGTMWIPLADIAAAFKGRLSPNAAAGGALKPQEAIQLNFTPNLDAILIGL